jgi:hypothetical protein
MKKNSIREEKKKLKRKKNKIGNILKEKQLKGKKLVTSVLSAVMLCDVLFMVLLYKILYSKMMIMQIYSLLLTQLKHFYILKKALLTCCGVRVNMLIIILLRNDYFLKYIF